MARVDVPFDRRAITPLRLCLILLFLLSATGLLVYLVGKPLMMTYWGRECASWQQRSGGSMGQLCCVVMRRPRATGVGHIRYRPPARAPCLRIHACLPAVYARVKPMVSEQDLMKKGKEIPGTSVCLPTELPPFLFPNCFAQSSRGAALCRAACRELLIPPPAPQAAPRRCGTS